MIAANDAGGGAQILDARIGAGANEDAVDGDVLDAACRAASAMYSRARSKARRSSSVLAAERAGTRSVTGVTMPGLVPQLTYGARDAASI